MPGVVETIDPVFYVARLPGVHVRLTVSNGSDSVMAPTTASATAPIVKPKGTPRDVKVLPEPREPEFDPQAGVPGSFTFPAAPKPQPPHRLVVIGDSLSHGFQSGAIYNTDISYPAIIAYELGWFDDYRYPKYGGPGGLPLNIEYLLRDLEGHYGEKIDWWEVPGAVFRGRELMDKIEDYWERGAGNVPPTAAGINHDLSVYGWDLRDALSRTYQTCLDDIETPRTTWSSRSCRATARGRRCGSTPQSTPVTRCSTPPPGSGPTPRGRTPGSRP